MPLIAIPFSPASSVGIRRSGNAAGLQTELQRLFASLPPSTFLVDLQLTGAGAGGLWHACCVFTDDPAEATVIARVGSLLVRVVAAADAPELEAQINFAGQALSLLGAQWGAKLVEAGAGSGPAWLAVLIASTDPRPVPTNAPGFTPTFGQLTGATVECPVGTTEFLSVTHTSQTGRIFYMLRVNGLAAGNPNTLPATGAQLWQLDAVLQDSAVDIFASAVTEWTPDMVIVPGLSTGTVLSTFGSHTTTPGVPRTVKGTLLLDPSVAGEVAIVNLGAISVWDVPL